MNQQMTQRSSISTAALLLAIVALDSFAFTLVLPLLPVFLEQQHTATWLMVLIFASFSICQFFAAPQLGRLADRFGRKRVLLLSQAGTLIGFLLLAWAPTPGWMLPSRIVDGITAANLAIVNAVICDLYDDRDRSGAFARVNAAGAFGVIIGLGAAASFAHQSLATLALAAAGAAALTVVVGLVTPFPQRRSNVDPVPLRQVFTRFTTLRRPATAVIASQVVMTGLMSAMTLLLTQVGDINARTALILVLLGLLCGGTIQGVLAAPVERALGTARAVASSVAMLLVGAVLFAALARANSPSVVGLGLAIVVLSAGSLLLMSTATALLSQSAAVGAGLLMGINQSLSAIGQLLGPALGLLFVSYGWGWLLAFIVAAAAGALVVLQEGPPSEQSTAA